MRKLKQANPPFLVFSLILSLERSLSTRERGKRERGKQEKKESEMEGKPRGLISSAVPYNKCIYSWLSEAKAELRSLNLFLFSRSREINLPLFSLYKLFFFTLFALLLNPLLLYMYIQ